jgi:3-phosphoshikimate 1-carboxyvinyltransferase
VSTAVRAVAPVTAPLDATVRLPGSKSLTNRALLCAALADGRSVLDGALFADDSEAMLGALRTLGVGIDADPAAARVAVEGLGGRLPGGDHALDARLSGTTGRFLLPLAALGPGRYRLDGAPPLRSRPMADGIAAVRALGATVVEEGEPGRLPVVVHGAAAPLPTGQADGSPAELTVPGSASSQFVSGLLLCGPAWPGGLRLTTPGRLVSRPYVDMTVAVMRAFGGRVETVDTPGGTGWVVAPGGYRAADHAVEPDASAASYFVAAAAVCGGRVTIEGLGRHALQGDVAFVDVLERMGCRVERGDGATTVERTGALHGVDVDMSDISDTAQTLAAVAVFADSPTRVRGIAFIRGKETDRIGDVVRELRRCGIEADEEADGFVVRPGTPRPARVATYDDHRMAMSFALLGLRVPGIEIADPGCVAKTFPGFWDALDALRPPAGRDAGTRWPQRPGDRRGGSGRVSRRGD